MVLRRDRIHISAKLQYIIVTSDSSLMNARDDPKAWLAGWAAHSGLVVVRYRASRINKQELLTVDSGRRRKLRLHAVNSQSRDEGKRKNARLGMIHTREKKMPA